MTTDCLVIGFNSSSFENYVNMVRSMGTEHGAYRDLSLAFVEYEGKPRTSMDMLNHFHFEDEEGPTRLFHNSDFLWPVITYLGTYLDRRGFKFDYVNLFHMEQEQLKRKLENDDILTIAITTTLYVSPHPILEIMSFIKQYNRKAKVIVGGPYIGNQMKMSDVLSNAQLFKFIGADIYVNSNEGEATLVEILKALKTGKPLDGVDNISFRKGERYVTTGVSTESNPLEENMVNYALFPRQEYGEFVTLRTAKSCPFACSFCGFPQRAGKYKYLSVELVEQELNAIRDIGDITTLTFIDDTFNVPKERFKQMLRMMIRNNYGFKWNSFYRSDHGDEETIELMAAAGCEGVFLGIESGNDETLHRMNKTARRKDYLKSIPLLREAGISTHANLIIGFPGETYESMQDSVSLIEETKPDFYRAQLWYADPVTPIWQKREQYGVEGSAFHWKHNTMDYVTASDLVDELFLGVENSTWLPQNGFEQWSTFYLQRKGMSLDRIKKFLRCFNALIKDHLIHPGKTELDAAVLEELRVAAQFNKYADAEVETAAAEAYAGRRYMDAHEYWLGRFADADSVVPGTAQLRDRFEAEKGELRSMACRVEGPLLAGLAGRCQASAAETLLAAFTTLTSRLNGKEQVNVIATTGDERGSWAVPLELRPTWEMKFSDYVRQVREQRESAIEHGRFALHLLTSHLRDVIHGLPRPTFDLAFEYAQTGGEAGGTLRSALVSCPDLLDRIALVLSYRDSGGVPRVEISYAEGWFKETTIAALAGCLEAIITATGAAPDVRLGEIVLEPEETVAAAASTADAAEMFNF